MPSDQIHFVECPRDAMQGWKTIIPTEKKVTYLNALLQVGFDTLDCGSFVSAKAIPQMADTKQVLEQLSLKESNTKLLVIVANVRGAEEAVQYDKVTYLGFPFSISSTFQLRNANSTIEESFKRVQAIQTLCLKHNKKLVIYLSMGFGNPYGDEYNEEILFHWANKIAALGVEIISLADTVGMATPLQITNALKALVPKYPQVSIGVHLHATSQNFQVKLQAAIDAGCRRFDGALKGIGGCPMAADDLVGNMNTELMIPILQKDFLMHIDELALQKALQLADETFII